MLHVLYTTGRYFVEVFLHVNPVNDLKVGESKHHGYHHLRTNIKVSKQVWLQETIEVLV